MASKALGLLAQLILARLLLRVDFGLFGLTLTVATFCRLLEQAGVRDVLISRQRAFRTWANAGFWLSLASGVVAGGLMVALAPWAARFYTTDDPARLIQLITLMAITSPLSALATVPAARLQIQMRFRAIASVEVAATAADAACKVALAWLGFGALSFVLASVLAAILRLAAVWTLAPVRLRWTCQLRRWKYLVRNGAMVVVATFCYVLIGQGDYIVLGHFASPEVVGVYFLAFNFSMHTITLLTVNLSRVLLPALSQLAREPQRQLAAFVRASRTLALVAIPLCFGQAAVAGPVVRLLFQERWYGAIPLIQLLSVGMALRTVSWPTVSLMQAQGRFRARMLLSIASVLIFFPLIVGGYRAGGVLGVALAVAGFYVGVTLTNIYLALISSPHPWSDMAHICVRPIVLSALTLCAALLLGAAIARQLPASAAADLLQVIVTVVVSMALYVPLVRRLDAEPWREAIGQLARLSPGPLKGLLAMMA